MTTITTQTKGGGIYVITNTVNGKQYVGSALCLRRRMSEHLRRLRKNAHHSPMLQLSWNKYTETAFVFEVLEFVEEKTALISREQAWIDMTQPAFNVCKIAGSPLGTKQSEESKRKKSDAARGRKLSDEHIAKLKLAAFGRKPPCTPEVIEKRAAKMRGRTQHPDVVARRAAKRRGQKFSDESKLRLSNAIKGKKRTKPFTEEHRANLSKAQIGRKMSPEHKAALSILAKLRGAPVLSKESRDAGDTKRRGVKRTDVQKQHIATGKFLARQMQWLSLEAFQA